MTTVEGTLAPRMDVPERDHAIALGVAVAIATLYVVMRGTSTGTDEYLPIAGALLHGHLDIEPQGWFELVFIDGRAYSPFPLVPALFYLPAAALGLDLPVTVLPSLLGGASVAIAFLLLRRQGTAREPALWITAGFATTTLWWAASHGGTHLMAEVSATFFLLGAIWFALDRRRPVVAGLLFALAVGSRLPVGASLPLFVYLYRRETWRFVAGALPVATFVGLYNLARFGSPVDFGYARIFSDSSPNGLVTGERWYHHGIESPLYIPSGLQAMLFSWPTLISDPPWVKPSLIADSLLITAPFLAWAFLARGRLALVLGVSAALIVLVDLMHGNPGISQFGYRYILDAEPLLVVMLGIAMPVRAGFWFGLAVVVGAVATGYAFWAQSIGLMG